MEGLQQGVGSQASMTLVVAICGVNATDVDESFDYKDC